MPSDSLAVSGKGPGKGKGSRRQRAGNCGVGGIRGGAQRVGQSGTWGPAIHTRRQRILHAAATRILQPSCVIDVCTTCKEVIRVGNAQLPRGWGYSVDVLQR